MIQQPISRPGRRLASTAVMFALALLLLSFVGVSVVSANGPAQDSEIAKFETDFMQMMIDHHNLAREMATICLQKASHDELRNMCQSVIDMQGKEIQDMQTWLSSWYQITKEPMLPPEGQQQLDQLNAASNGEEFERMFMPMLIEHHTMALERATPCVDRAEHGDLKNLCENIISSQQKEIEQLQAWLAEWYNVSANAAQATPGATAEMTMTPEANATVTPSPSAPTTLPQTGSSFETNALPVLIGLLLLGAGVVLFQVRRKTP